MNWWQRPPAFSQLNLRCNPFGELSAEERGRLAVLNVDSIQPRRFQPVQIIADVGHGKTTHLLALAHRVANALYEYVPCGSNSFHSRPGPDQLFLLDEAQRVRRSHLRSLCRFHPWLVFGTHEDLSPWCPHPLRTLQLTTLSLEKLQQVVQARLLWARDPAIGDPPLVSAALLEELRSRHGANIRAIEDELYNRYQRENPNDETSKPISSHGPV